MKRLAKFLALFLLVIVGAAASRSVFNSFAAGPNDTCPVLGNNLIDNIDHNVLINLRQQYKQMGAAQSCPIPATFLFRSPDFENQKQMDLFFKTANEQNIRVVVRVASDNYYDLWEPITPQVARADAESLNQAISKYNFGSNRPVAVFGNEVNFANEWGNTEDLINRATSYARSLIAFAQSARNFDVLLSPLSLSGPDPQLFWNTVFATLYTEFGTGATDAMKCQSTLNWINANIKGYAMTLYTHSPTPSDQGVDDIMGDYRTSLQYLANAGSAVKCSGAFPLQGKKIVITEFGIQGGIYIKGMEQFLWTAYQRLLSSAQLANQIYAVTSFVWDKTAKKITVHGFYYVNGGAKLGEIPYPALNLGGSTSHGIPGYFVGPSDAPIFDALGSLEACPEEIAVDSKFVDPIVTIVGGRCGITPIDEPGWCHDIDEAWRIKLRGDRTGDPTDACPEGVRTECYSDSCDYLEQHDFTCRTGCGPQGCDDDTAPHRTRLQCGIFPLKECTGEGYTDGQPPDDDGNRAVYDRWQLIKHYFEGKADCAKLTEDEKRSIGKCMAYLKKSPNIDQTKTEVLGGLPVCVPTHNATGRCVSECGQPIKFTERLTMLLTDKCVKSGNCAAKIGLNKNADGSNGLFIPFAGKLGDYFTGSLDAEHQTAGELDNLQKTLRAGGTDQSAATEELFNKAGVARKLLPADIQDKLKCDFISYVNEKKTSLKNTKYLEKIDGKLTGREFKIFDKNITELFGHCPPDRMDAPAYNAWSNSYSKYWTFVPLFQNDEAQGKIEFASPTIFSTRNGINDKGQVLGPVFVSIPDIGRLDAVTNLLQSAFVPKDLVFQRELAIVANPKQTLPTFGKPLKPATIDNVCTPDQKWDYFYGPEDAIDENGKRIIGADKITPLTQYTRGVACNVQAITDADGGKICTVGEDGQIRCARQGDQSAYKTGVQNFEETVQVRSVFPHLFDIAEQTITKSTGFLRIFKPENTNTLRQVTNTSSTNVPGAVDFDKNYDPIPAEVGGVKYSLSGPDNSRTGPVGLGIDDSQNREGWKLFFYKLGGVWNARNFVLDLISPRSGADNQTDVKSP